MLWRDFGSHLVWWILSGLLGLGIGWLLWGRRSSSRVRHDEHRVRAVELGSIPDEGVTDEALLASFADLHKEARSATSTVRVIRRTESSDDVDQHRPDELHPDQPVRAEQGPHDEGPHEESPREQGRSDQGPDELEHIYGVGPKLAELLREEGISTFREVAEWTEAHVARFSERIPAFKDRIEKEGWIESAKEEHFKKYGERIAGYTGTPSSMQPGQRSIHHDPDAS